MPDTDDLPSIKDLDEAIKKAKKRSLEDDTGKKPSGMRDAMSISIELVAGVILGVVLGLYLDEWFGTAPIFFIICFFLGVAGSGLNIYRMAVKINDEDSSAK